MDILPLPVQRLIGPEPLTVAEIAAYVVGAAVRAPSVHNTEPWWFSGGVQEIGLYPPPSVLFASGGEHLSISHE